MPEIPVGAALDALVSERIFGQPWELFEHVSINDRPGGWTWLPRGSNPHSPPGESYAGMRPPRYSSEIGQAWEIVERLTTTTKEWFRCEQSCITYEATFAIEGAGDRDDAWTAKGDSIAEAICRAALLATDIA